MKGNVITPSMAVADEFGDDRDFDKRDTVGSPSVWHWGEGTQFLPIQVQ